MNERPRAAPELGVMSLSHTRESIMDVKEAVQTAKLHIADIFSDEPIMNVGLEEVEFNESDGVWAITIGFSRSWDSPGGVMRALGGDAVRTFKTVRIEDESGRVESIKHRNVAGDR